MSHFYLIVTILLIVWVSTWPVPGPIKRRTLLDSFLWPVEVISFTTLVAYAILKRHFKGRK